MCASIGVTGAPRLAVSRSDHANALRRPCRVCAATGMQPAPFLNGQMSVSSTPCQYVCKHRRDRRPKVGSQPAKSRQCSPTPLPRVRRHVHAAPAPFLNGQKSVSSTPCQYVSKHRCDRRPKVGSQPCRSGHCSPTPLPSVRGHGHAAPAPFLNGQKSVASTPSQDVCKHRSNGRPKVGSQPGRSRQCSPTPLPSVRGHGHAAPAPFLNGQMSVTSTPCQYVCKHRCDRRQRSAISLRRTAFALRHSRRLCAATGTRRHQVVLGTAPYQASRLRLRC